MGKFIVCLAAGVGLAAASAGGTYLFRGPEPAPSPYQPEQPPQPQLPDGEISGSLADFKSGKGDKCVSRYFSSLRLSGPVGETWNGDDEITFPGSDSPQSCLTINWTKTESTSSENKKWKGNFRWLWTFIKGNHGFVMFSSTRLSDSANTLDLESGIYFVDKDDASDSWSIKKNREKSESLSKIDRSNFENTFPAAGGAITDFGKNKYWGFMAGSEDLPNLCKLSEESGCIAGESQEKTFKGTWTWHPDTKTSNSLDHWSNSLSTSLNNIYGVTGSKLQNSLQQFKGNWKKESLVSTDQ